MYWITHFTPEDTLPKHGMRKLAFCSQQKDPNEFFWGTDNNPFSKEEIEELATIGKIILIPQKLPLKEHEEALYIDSKGALWLAHYTNSDKNKKEIGFYDVLLKKFFQELNGSV